MLFRVFRYDTNCDSDIFQFWYESVSDKDIRDLILAESSRPDQGRISVLRNLLSKSRLITPVPYVV